MNLLRKLQEERGTAIVLITHDLGVVAGHAGRVIVMYAGKVAEAAGADELYHAPRHPYTLGLLSSIARLDRRRTQRLQPIPGQPPSLIRVPPGCSFHPRCSFATEICSSEVPTLTGAAAHRAACHHQDQVVDARAAAGVT
jgi:oligopeptide/dipeptide ABC transporter ATP-binding protein